MGATRKPVDPETQALQLLARREHSARELKRKLTARGVAADVADAAVAHATREGWQSDARYAAVLVRARIGQGYGPVRIEAELKVAGIAADAVAAALAAADVDWHALAAEVHAKRFGGPPRSSAERARQYRFLQGRGFASGHIGAVLKGAAED